MKYLKRYNENSSDESGCKNKVGYTEQELKDIFQLNLEDNSEFDVLDIRVIYNKFYIDTLVFMELTIDFSNSLEFDKHYKSWNDGNRTKEIGNKYGLPTSEPISYKDYVYDVSKKSIDIICKKYDLEVCKDIEGPSKMEVSHTSWDNTTEFDIRFTVRKIKTI